MTDLELLALVMLHCCILNRFSHCLAQRQLQMVQQAQHVASEVVFMQGSTRKNSECNSATYRSIGAYGRPKAVASHYILSSGEETEHVK